MKNAREYKKSQAEAAREQHNTILEVPLEPGQPVSAKFFFLTDRLGGKEACHPPHFSYYQFFFAFSNIT